MNDALGSGEALVDGRQVDAAYEAATIVDIAEMVVQFSYTASCVRWLVVVGVVGGWSLSSWAADRDYWCP